MEVSRSAAWSADEHAIEDSLSDLGGEAVTTRLWRTPTVSVVMVSYFTGPSLFTAVEAALAASDVDEVVLVNHQNPADDVERLNAWVEREPRLKLIHTGANLGFSKGCNIGARAAVGDRLLFLNPDTVLPAGAAERLAKTGVELSEPWIVGARLIDSKGAEQRGARRGELTPLTALAGYLGLSRVLPFVRDIHREKEPLPAAALPTPVVSGAALMMSRVGFERVGGFDESYFLHVEDIDLCRRARDAGGEVVFEPRASILHYGSTSKVSLFAVESAKAQGLVKYFARHGGRTGWLQAGLMAPLVWGAVMARAALIQLGGRARATDEDAGLDAQTEPQIASATPVAWKPGDAEVHPVRRAQG